MVDKMVLVSASRLQLRGLRFALPFLLKAYRIGRELRRAPGFLGGALLREGRGRYWTCTLWEDHTSMERFRNKGQHLDAMTHRLDWTEELVHGNWEQEDATMPDWHTLHRKLAAHAHFTKLKHATDIQRERAVGGFDSASSMRAIEIKPVRRDAK